MLLISPEQLRSPSVRSVLNQREVGFWVLDEAHCVSKWGHDFRPDYRYIARFIKEYSGDESPAPLICLTATAKPAVIRDITDHFRSRLGVSLELVDGGAVRTNLAFEVVPTNKARKQGDIAAVLEYALPKEGWSGAIVYCSTRSATESVSGFLKEKGFAAAHYHAGLKTETKKEVQQQFYNGELRVIAATNAFGMGIDKPDIRLVVHGDTPGSLENYLQEAGRAGRDREAARCVLLFNSDLHRSASPCRPLRRGGSRPGRGPSGSRNACCRTPRRRLGQTRWGGPRSLFSNGFSYRNRRATARAPDPTAPFCASRRDMRPDDGAVEHLHQMRGAAQAR
jgi:ATP-dependent DNA helicase RecQ